MPQLSKPTYYLSFPHKHVSELFKPPSSHNKVKSIQLGRMKSKILRLPYDVDGPKASTTSVNIDFPYREFGHTPSLRPRGHKHERQP